MMKVLCCFAMITLFVACAFAQDGTIESGQKAFTDCINIMENIFDQTLSLTGKDGTKVTCTIMPQEEMTAVAWEIVNPEGGIRTISSGDISLYGQEGQYEMIDTEEAVKLFYKGRGAVDTSDGTAEAIVDDQNMPGEDMEEGTFFGSEFKFGNTDSSVIRGITYFAVSLKHVKSVTAEIKINGESYKFPFDGNGP